MQPVVRMVVAVLLPASLGSLANGQAVENNVPLKMNQIQVIGTHNSYYAAIAPSEGNIPRWATLPWRTMADGATRPVGFVASPGFMPAPRLSLSPAAGPSPGLYHDLARAVRIRAAPSLPRSGPNNRAFVLARPALSSRGRL